MGVNFTEFDFYLQQQNADNKWLVAASIAVGLHVVLLAWAFFLPDIFDQKLMLDEFVTVDLISMPEPQALPVIETPPPPAAEQPVAEQLPQLPPESVQPEPAEVEIPIEPEVVPEPMVEAKPISVKPLKRKIKTAVDTRLAEEKEREKRATALREKERQQKRDEQLEQERKQKAAAARKAAAVARADRARKEADQAARDARKALADMYRSQGALERKTTPSAASGSGTSGRQQVQSIVAQQYYAALYSHIQGYWVLPEMRKWDPHLEATVVLVINQNGQVLKTTVEKKSQDPFFNQVVVKTLHSAAPMPIFPKLMKERTIEVGLRFRPGKLEM